MHLYILTNKIRSTRYIGITSDLKKRLYEHRTKKNQDSFTAQYNIHILIYFEAYENPHDAIAREKQLKGWTRKKKDALIHRMNPQLNDLAASWDDF